MSVLVTGANGQLGSEIRRISDGYPYNFIFTDVDTLDITDHNSVDELIVNNDITFVINCAAYTAVDDAESNEDLAEEINADAVKNLVHAAKKNGAVFIQISTDYVFDGEKEFPYTEDDEEDPQTVYGNTKLDGEREALKYDKSVVIRTSWMYSVYGHNFVKTIKRLTAEKNVISVVNDQYGSLTNAADLAKAILDNLEKLAGFDQPQIFNYSNEGVTTWYEVATVINSFYGHNCNILPVSTDQYPSVAHRPRYSVLDKSKFKSVFHVSIPNWEESLLKVLEEIEEFNDDMSENNG